MQRSRSYYDADREDKHSVPTTFPTEQNTNALKCSLCAGTVFVDDLVFNDVGKVIENTAENPFICEDCLSEYHELAY